MRKKYISTILMLSIGATILSSCNFSIENKNYGKYIEKNTDEENVENDDPSFVKFNKSSYLDLEKDKIVNDAYYSAGLLVIKNQTGNIGFYSITHMAYIVKPMFSEYYLDYNVQVDNVGFILTITYLHERYVYDSFGNLLYQVTEEKIDNSYSYTTTINNQQYTSSTLDQVTYSYVNNADPNTVELISTEMYLVIKFNGETEREYIYQYNNNYSISIVSNIPDKNIDVENNFIIGNKYTDIQKIDLTPYGYKNYYLSKKDKYYTLFKTNAGNDSSVVSFVIPSDVEDDSLIFLDHYCIYQRKIELPEDSSNYKFFDEDTKKKYDFFSYRVDWLTGKTEEIKINYYINSIEEYKDTDGTIKYGLIQYQEIINNVLQPTKKSGIIDSTYNVLKDVTSTAPVKYLKLDDKHYYNEETKIVYDNNMNEKVYLSAINPELDPDSKIFIGCIDGLYGAIDYDGNIVADFRYKEFICDFVDGYGIGSKINENITEYYRINTNNKTSEYLGDNIKKVCNNLYYVLSEKIEETKTYKAMLLLSEKESINYHTFETALLHDGKRQGITKNDVSLGNKNLLNENSSAFIKVTAPSNTNYYINTKEKNVNNLISRGTEVNSIQIVGQSKNYMPMIKTGSFNLTLTSKTGFKNYFAFTGESNKYYTLNFDKNVQVNIYDSEGNAVSTESKSNVVYFKSNGSKYTIEITSSYNASLDMNNQTNYLNCNVIYEYGQNAEYPIEANMLNNVNVEKNKTYYVKFTPQVSGNYYFKMNGYTISTNNIYTAKYSQPDLSNNNNIMSAYLVSGITYELCLISKTTENTNHDLFIELGEKIDADDSPLSHNANYYTFYNVTITNPDTYYLYNDSNNDNFVLYRYNEETKEFILEKSGTLSNYYQELKLSVGKYYIGVKGLNSTAYLIKGSGNYSETDSKQINSDGIYSGVYFKNSHNLFYRFYCTSTRDYSIINNNNNSIIVKMHSNNSSTTSYNLNSGEKVNVSLVSGYTYYFEVEQSETNRDTSFELEYLYKLNVSVDNTSYGTLDVIVNNKKPDTTYCSKGDSISLITGKKGGYTFLGWYDGNTLVSDKKEYNFVMPSKDLTYQAKYANYTLTYSTNNTTYGTVSGDIDASAKVTFDSQGGSSVASQTITKTNGLVYPTKPTKSGYIFSGWYKNLTDTSAYDFSQNILEDLTLYAKWVKMETGYSSSEINIIDYTSSSNYYSQYTQGSSSNPTYRYFSIPTNGTYTFYYRNSSSSSSYYYTYFYVENVTKNSVIKSNSTASSTSWNSFTFTANAGDVIMVRTYPYNTSNSTNLYYYVSGITSATAGGLLTVNKTSGSSVSAGENVILTAKENTGYTFLGWYDGNILVSEDKVYEFTMPNKSINYQAKFANYTLTYSTNNTTYGTVSGDIDASAKVTFDSQGGSSVASQTITKTNGLVYPSNPTRTGYAFSGWYKNLTDTNPFDFSQDISDDLTLYAKWIQMETGHSSSEINIMYYTNTSNYYSQYTQGSSSNPTYRYFSIPTSGTYTFYYRNSSSSSSYYYTYFYVENVTKNSVIKSNSTASSTSWNSITFTANAGDVIMVRTYPYNTSYSPSLYYYVSGITSAPDGGLLNTNKTSGSSITAGKNVILTAKENTGYTFLGWYDGDTLVSEDKVYEFTMPNKSINYQAKFANFTLSYSSIDDSYGTTSANIKKDSALVKFDSQGGSGVFSQTITKTNGLVYPSKPTRTGYAFSGWYENLSDTTPYDFSQNISDDLTLYAKWVKMNTGYSSNEINIIDYTSSSNYYSQIAQGSSSNPTYRYFSIPTSGTYSFYYRNSSSSSSNYYTYFYVANVTKNSVIKSNSTASSTSWYSFSFTANAGDVIMVRTYPYNTSYSPSLYYYVSGITSATAGGLLNTNKTSGSSITAGETVILTAEENTGYSFLGWYDGDTLVSEDKVYKFTMPNRSINYQAKFEIEE